MTKLSELNKTINSLNDLWPLLQGDEKAKVLDVRNQLNEQASELAHKTLRDGVAELSDAINELNEATQAAKEAKSSIDDDVARINKVAETVTKVADATGKVARLVAVL